MDFDPIKWIGMDKTWILARLSGSKIDCIPIKWIGMDRTWILARLSGSKVDFSPTFWIANLILPHPTIKFFPTPTLHNILPLHFAASNPYTSP